MNLSSIDNYALESNPTETINTRQQRREIWSTLGILSALVLAMTCGLAHAQTLVTTLSCGPNPSAVVVNQTTNMIYVSDIDLDTVTAINGATNTETTINTTGFNALNSLAVNETTNTVYAVYEGVSVSGTVTTPGSVFVINGATNTVSTTIALPDLGTHVAVNPVTNQIYVSTLSGIGNGVAANVRVIDGATNTITATISIPAIISSLVVDTTRNLVYAMHVDEPGTASIAVIDGATNTVTATITVGYNDTTLALDETTNTLYVPDAHGAQIYVIDGATDTVTTTVPIPNALQPYYLTVNPATNTIYATAYNTNNGAGSVQVMDGSTNTLTTNFSVPSALGQLLANSVTNKIWQAASPVEIIDGASNTTTSVTGTSGLSINLGALNTTTNYAYMVGPANVYVINGAATGPAFSASPSPVAFGNQPVGATSNAMTLTVTNTGTGSLSISSVMEGGTDAAEFPVGSDTCSNATVASGKTCTVSVEFDPSASGSESATLTFTDNASDSPETVNLTGTGVSAPAVMLAPTSLTFATQAIGSSSAAQPVMLSDTGNAALNISGISITGANAGDFTQTNTCGTSVAMSANCTINVTFTPTAAGTRTASVSIADNAGGSPQTVSVTGTATTQPPDFGLTTSPGSATIRPGGPGVFDITVTSENGFDSAVSFACSGAPSGYVCVFSPATVTPGGAAVSTSLSIGEDSAVASASPNSISGMLPGAAFACVLCCFVGFRKRRLSLLLLFAVALSGLGLAITGCGSSMKTSSSKVTITATSGSLQHTATVTLNVM